MCILPPAAATELNVVLWPLWRASLSGSKCDNCKGITVNLKKKKGFIPEECTQVYTTVQEYLIRLSQKESDTTYLIRLQSHEDLTPQTTLEIRPELRLTRTYRRHRWWFLGTNRSGMDLLLSLSSCVHLYNLFYACFLSFLFIWFLKLLSEKSDYICFFFREEEKNSSSLTRVDL